MEHIRELETEIDQLQAQLEVPWEMTGDGKVDGVSV